MFSSLAQGRATWEGGVDLEDTPVDPVSSDLFLRPLPVSPYQSHSKLTKPHEVTGTVLDDGQIVLPKTFVTRKGALLLFTPNEEVQVYKQHKGPTGGYLPAIYEDELIKLGTVCNLANTVLQFGREEEHTPEGLPLKGEKPENERRVKNKQALLKFLHYLDSDSGLQGDWFTQPGCDQSFYLDELKAKSSSPTEYTLMSTSPDHAHSFPRMVATATHDNFSPVCWSPVQVSTEMSSRPHTAPIPPQPQSPRANPRITSAKPPPPTRVLGSTPSDLREVLHADIGRTSRRTSSQILRFSRSESPGSAFVHVHPRGGSPEYNSATRLGVLHHSGTQAYSSLTKEGTMILGNNRQDNASTTTLQSPVPTLNEHPRSPDVIDEEDEVSCVSSRWVSHRGYRPSTGSSLKSIPSPEQVTKRRISSAGATSQLSGENENRFSTRTASRSTSRIVSAASNVQRPSTTASVFTRDDDLSSVQYESEASDRDQAAEGRLNVRTGSTRSIREKKNSARSQSVLSLNSSCVKRVPSATLSENDQSAARILSARNAREPAEDNFSTDKEKLDNSSPNSRPESTRPISVLSQRLTNSRVFSTTSQCSRGQASRQSQRDRVSAGSPQSFFEDGTIATLGSGADLNDVTENIIRNQSVTDGLLDDVYREEDSSEMAWPQHDEDQYGSEAEEIDIDMPSSRSSPVVNFDDDLGQRQEEHSHPWTESPHPELDGVDDPLRYVNMSSRNSIGNIEHVHNTVSPVNPELMLRPGSVCEFDIRKSRPTSAIGDHKRSHPVSVTEAVKQYIEEGQRPQSRLALSRKGSLARIHDEPIVSLADNEAEQPFVKFEREANEKQFYRPKSSASRREASKPPTFKDKQNNEETNNEKTASIPKESNKRDLPSVGLTTREVIPKRPEPTDAEKEARREFVNSLLSKPKMEKERGSLGLEGEGQSVEETYKTTKKVLVKSPTQEDQKTDLSSLASLLGPPKTPKEKKSQTKKKLMKSRKSSKKKAEAISVDPENIDFDTFNSPEMLKYMDDELKQFVQQQGKSNAVANEAAVAKEDPTSGSGQDRRVSIQTLEVPSVALQLSGEKEGAHSPSKTKKPTKKELAAKRAQARKEEKKRKEEEKRAREEELELQKQWEAEAERAREEVELKQRMIEEEKARRLAEEEEARREEQEAQEKLKYAKRKAREEREARRALAAERRRQEVQRKREEKQRRDQEMREREIEAEKRKLDRERRMAQLAEQRRLQMEIERREEEQRKEEERLHRLQQEEEERRLEEERIREAEEELRRLQEEREHKEQMRRIAEAQAEKLHKAEEERLRQEEEERRRVEEEKLRLEEEKLARLLEEQKRQEIAKRLETVARMRSAHRAAIKRSLLLRRREQNLERAQNLKFTRQNQGFTRSNVFTYFIHLPRQIWELPIGFDKKKKEKKMPKRKSP